MIKMEPVFAKSITVKQFSGDDIENDINGWLMLVHPETQIIEVKFTASATEGNWGCDALVIYRPYRKQS